MNKEKIRGIYKITNTINNKLYIGESLDIYRRWDKHKEDLNNTTHHSYKLQHDWNEYDEDNFKFEIIEELDKDIANYIDQYVLIVYEDKYIKEYDSINNGYNVEETLKEIQLGNKSITNNIKKDQAMIKNVIKNLENHNGMYKISEKTLKRKEGDKNLQSNKVYCMELKQLYNTAKEATKKCNISSTGSITNVCKKGGGKAKLKDGTYLTFIYEDDYIKKYGDIEINKKTNNKLKERVDTINITTDIIIPKDVNNYTYPNYLKANKMSLKEFTQLLEKNGTQLLIAYTKLCKILRDNNIYKYVEIDGKNKMNVTDTYLNLDYFKHRVCTSLEGTQYYKIEILQDGIKFIYRLLNDNNLIAS